MLTIVLLAIVIALLFDFLNGMNDAANSIATIVATRVFSPTMAVCWAAFWNFAAIFIFGVSVAHTMGEGIVDPSKINEYLILAALIGSVIWVWLCTHFGMPISVSHALIGGLIGPVWFTFGGDALVASGIFIGMILGFFMMCLTMLVFHKKHPMKVEGLFKGLQLFSSAIFSLGHGANDAQKTMGIIAILLYSVAGSNTFVSDYLYENTGEFHVPAWLIVTCYSVIALGTIIGGKKVIKTLGDGLARLKPVQGFCAETSGALTLITGSIIGVGITKGVASVRWATATNIVAAWILTIPATVVMSGLVYWVMGLFLTLPE